MSGPQIMGVEIAPDQLQQMLAQIGRGRRGHEVEVELKTLEEAAAELAAAMQEHEDLRTEMCGLEDRVEANNRRMELAQRTMARAAVVATTGEELRAHKCQGHAPEAPKDSEEDSKETAPAVPAGQVAGYGQYL